LKRLNCKKFFGLSAGICRLKTEDNKFEDKKTNLSSFRIGGRTGLIKKTNFSIYINRLKLKEPASEPGTLFAL